jgi:ABC-type dipeptide/oligopeptide/nickel transport system permease component
MPAGLAGYIARRLLIVPFTLLVVSFAAFSLGRFAPGDYVEAQAPPRANPETIERIRHERGLDDPVYEQYVRYVGNLLQGDLGISQNPRGVPVEDVLFPRLWVTVQINILALIFTWLIGIPLGTWAALRRGTWMDPLSIGVFVFLASIPVLISVPILEWILIVKLKLLPTGGWSTAEYFGVKFGMFSSHAVLPVLVLTITGVAGLARYMRTQMIEVLDQDFVRTAHSKGLRGDVVIMRHVLRNAMLPIVTIFGFELAGLMGGSIFVETLLGIPGVGQLAFQAVTSRDYDTIMAIVLLGSTAFVMAMLAVDIAYGFVDPRIRSGGGTQT